MVGIGLEPGRQLCPKDLIPGSIAVPGSQSERVIGRQRRPQLGERTGQSVAWGTGWEPGYKRSCHILVRAGSVVMYSPLQWKMLQGKGVLYYLCLQEWGWGLAGGRRKPITSVPRSLEWRRGS